jgi:hypothetical protein
MSTTQARLRTYRNPNYQIGTGFVVTLFVGFLAINVASSFGLSYFGIGVQVALTVMAAWSIRHWWTTTLMVTSHALVVRRGRVETELSFDRITDIYLDDFLFVRSDNGDTIQIGAVQEMYGYPFVLYIYLLGNQARRADKVLDDVTAAWLHNRSAR